MRFSPTALAGAFVIDLDRHHDERGFFARTACVDEFAAHGVEVSFPQANVSHNTRRGTLRGMHYAVAPAAESKLVRCVVGAVYDVIVDLRVGSPTRHQWFGVELSRANGRAMYVPNGVAHGFLTLMDDTDVMYLMGDVHRPETSRGVRWDDPLLAIEWPFEPTVISDRDRTYPDADGEDPPGRARR